MPTLTTMEKEEFIRRAHFVARRTLDWSDNRRSVTYTIEELMITLQKLGGTASVMEVWACSCLILVVWYPSAQREWKIQSPSHHRQLNLLRGAMVLEDLAEV